MNKEINRLEVHYTLCQWIGYFGIDTIAHWLQGVYNQQAYEQLAQEPDDEQKHHEENSQPGHQLELW